MAKAKSEAYPQPLLDLMARKSGLVMKAQTVTDMGMEELAQPIWSAAAAYEEQIAPLLEALGRDLEAALHRVSAASCYQQAGELSRAANLYRAALAGPLRDDTRQEVEQMLAASLRQLSDVTLDGGKRRRSPGPPAKVPQP